MMTSSPLAPPGTNDQLSPIRSSRPTNATGAAKGKSAGYINEVEHLTIDQRIEAAKVVALLSIAQEISDLNPRNHGGGDGQSV